MIQVHKNYTPSAQCKNTFVRYGMLVWEPRANEYHWYPKAWHGGDSYIFSAKPPEHYEGAMKADADEATLAGVAKIKMRRRKLKRLPPL